jgi:hypothetical protein
MHKKTLRELIKFLNNIEKIANILNEINILKKQFEELQ